MLYKISYNNSNNTITNVICDRYLGLFRLMVRLVLMCDLWRKSHDSRRSKSIIRARVCELVTNPCARGGACPRAAV